MIQTKIDKHELDEFSKTFENYLRARRMGVLDALSRRVVSLMVGAKGVPGLYQLTKAHGATAATVAADVVERRKWKIMVGGVGGSDKHRAKILQIAQGKMGDGAGGNHASVLGRMGRGGNLDIARVSARGRRLSRADRARGTRAGLGGVRGGPVVPGSAAARARAGIAERGWMRKDKVLGLRQVMLGLELQSRKTAAGFTASGWLLTSRRAAWARHYMSGAGGYGAGNPNRGSSSDRGMLPILGQNYRQTFGKSETGFVVFGRERGENGYRATIVNTTPGMVRIQARHRVVEAALAASRADMLAYVAAKEKAAAAGLKRK